MDKILRVIFIALCLIGAIVAAFTCIHVLFGDEPITIVKEWSCERAVYSRSEQRLCGVGLVVRRRRGCLRVVDMLIKEGQWPLMKRRLYLRASVGCACEGESPRSAQDEAFP